MFTRIPLICLMIEGILLAAAVATLAPAALGAPPQGSLRAGLRRAQDENAGSNASSLQPPTLGYVGQKTRGVTRVLCSRRRWATLGRRFLLRSDLSSAFRVQPASATR